LQSTKIPEAALRLRRKSTRYLEQKARFFERNSDQILKIFERFTATQTQKSKMSGTEDRISVQVGSDADFPTGTHLEKRNPAPEELGTKWIGKRPESRFEHKNLAYQRKTGSDKLGREIPRSLRIL